MVAGNARGRTRDPTRTPQLFHMTFGGIILPGAPTKDLGDFPMFSTALTERCYAPALRPGIILEQTNTDKKRNKRWVYLHLLSPTLSLVFVPRTLPSQ